MGPAREQSGHCPSISSLPARASLRSGRILQGFDTTCAICHVARRRRPRADGGRGNPSANSGLDRGALCWRLKTRRYRRSASQLPQRGYRLVQRHRTTPDVDSGIAIDGDVTSADAFGDSAG